MKASTFILGFVTGVAVTVGVAFVFAKIGQSVVPEPEYFEEVGKVMPYNHVQIFQVLDNGAALAQKYNTSLKLPEIGEICYIPSSGRKEYYDKQVIGAPMGKCFRQIGVFSYDSENFGRKTVPVISLFDNITNPVRK